MLRILFLFLFVFSSSAKAEQEAECSVRCSCMEYGIYQAEGRGDTEDRAKAEAVRNCNQPSGNISEFNCSYSDEGFVCSGACLGYRWNNYNGWGSDRNVTRAEEIAFADCNRQCRSLDAWKVGRTCTTY